MVIYIALIIVELLFAFGIKLTIPYKQKQEQLIAGIGMFLVFLLLALKKDTVGIDIAGYKEQYEIAALMPWRNFDYVYFEKGYLLLTKFFAKAGVSFQMFMAMLYALLCDAVTRLIRRYSPNATVSILVFICYNFLVFSISGVRQTLGMAICSYAFLWCTTFTRGSVLGSVMLVLAAMTIHESAIVFFAVLVAILLSGREVYINRWILIAAAIAALRTPLWSLVKWIYGWNMTAFDFTGTFVFLAGMVVFFAFTYLYYRNRRVVLPAGEAGEKLFHYDAFLIRCVFLMLMCYIMFTGSTLLRANTYFTLFLIPGIPMMISKYEYRTRFILNTAICCFLLVLFYKETLAINQLELLPYLFFWQ